MDNVSSPIRILVVDDHPIFRSGIIGLLSDQPDLTLVAQGSNGREAIQQYRTQRPDITLIDLQMPDMNGLDAIIAICGEFPEARMIVLTTYAGDAQVLRALKAGAKAYLIKNLLHKDLLDTIRAVYAGKKALSPEASFEIAEHATDEQLSKGEVEVLRLIAAVSAGCCWECRAFGGLHCEATRATVIAGVLENQVEQAKTVGADQVVATDDDNAISNLPPLDAVADTVGGTTAEKLIAKVKTGGVFASVIAAPPTAAQYPSVKVVFVFAKFERKTLEFMADAVRDGKLVIPVREELPLSEAAKAQVETEKGGIGKILLVA